MLRHVVGDQKFFAGIRDYYRAYRDRNALTTDFQSAMERAAGRKLDWFFAEWFDGAGYPIYDAAWHWDDSARTLRLRVTQKQAALFRMPVDVDFVTGNKARRETVEVSEREQSFAFKLEGKPQRVIIDPDEWLLKVATLKEE